jgi:hypothetical protein
MQVVRNINISSDDEYIKLINNYAVRNCKSLDYCLKNNWCLYCRSHKICDNCSIGCDKCCPMVYAVMMQKYRYSKEDLIQNHINVPSIEDYCINTVYSRNKCCCPFCCNNWAFSLTMRNYSQENVEIISIERYLYINNEIHEHTLSDKYLSKSIYTLLLCLKYKNIPMDVIKIMAERLYYPYQSDSLKIMSVCRRSLQFCKENNWCLYCRSHIICECKYGCRICCPFIKTAIKTIRDTSSYYTNNGINSILQYDLKNCKCTECCPFCCQYIMLDIFSPQGINPYYNIGTLMSDDF